jgi:hypothetical protein
MYPRLEAPDFKYKKDFGEYSTKFRLSKNDAVKDIARISEGLEEAYKTECAKQGKPKLKRSANLPYKDEENDQGEPTGNVIFSFKLPGGFKDKKTGEMIALKPALFNKDGSIPTDPIWGGSTGMVCYELRPYYTDGLGFGMTLRLKAARIHKLVTKGQGGAEMYGFEVEPSAHEDGNDDAEEAPVVVAKHEGAANVKATSGDF